MRHFHRTSVAPAEVMAAADRFFATLGLAPAAPADDSPGDRTRAFAGPLGAMTLSARPEGGHYTFVAAETDQVGESRLDKNVKKFFLELHRTADPSHRPRAAY